MRVLFFGCLLFCGRPRQKLHPIIMNPFILRLLAGCCIVFAALSGLPSRADGVAMPRIGKAPVEMADQRAILHFDEKKGEETLFIDTQIQPKAQGGDADHSEYAWVVPLPAEPTKVEPASAGVFDVLQGLTAPSLVFDALVLKFAIGVFGLMAVATVCRVSGMSRMGVLAVLVTLVLFVGILVPVLGTASGGGGRVAVTVRRTGTVGVYDTAILSGSDGAAIREWLDQNRFPVPPAVAPAFAQLAKEGWCFVAMRVHEGAGAHAHPHPMKFVFPTKRAIYPMRLTQAGQAKPLTVDLFVLGAMEAKAPGFSAKSSLGIDQENLWTVKDGKWDGSLFTFGSLNVPIGSPELADVAADSKRLTWLRGVVPAGVSQEDVLLGTIPAAEPHREQLFSRSFAAEWGGFAAVLVLAGGLALAGDTWAKRLWAKGGLLLAKSAGVALAVGVVVFLCIPTHAAGDSPLNGKSRFHLLALRRNACLGMAAILNDPAYAPKPPARATPEWARTVILKNAERIGPDWRNLCIEGDGPDQFFIREEQGGTKVYYRNECGQELLLWPNDFLMR